MRIVTLLALLLTLTLVSVASAQPPRFELKGSVGWVLSEGITFTGQEVDGEVFNRLDLEDGISYGAGAGFYVNRNVEIAFLWDVQESEVVAKGSTSMPIGSLNIHNYHGAVIYNFGSYLDPIRPILFGGMGSTYYSGMSFTDVLGRPRTTGGTGKFSTIWGAGVKMFAGRSFGLQLDIKWTPTYIKSDPGGYWCDPYWGCYTTSNADYANQWKFGGTLIARF